MTRTADFLGAYSGATSQCSDSLLAKCEATESALETFHNNVNEIRSLQEKIFEALNDLLPQTLATMLEAELIFPSRTVRLSVLRRLYRIGVYLRPAHRKLCDISLSAWFEKELPGVLERTKQFLEDYFDDLRQCAGDVEAARSKLFSAFNISVATQNPDLNWIQEITPSISSVSSFAWQVPIAWLFFRQIPGVRGFLFRRYEREISATLAAYCDGLIRIARQAARDWLSDLQWQADQRLLERTANWMLCDEIEKRGMVGAALPHGKGTESNVV